MNLFASFIAVMMTNGNANEISSSVLKAKVPPVGPAKRQGEGRAADLHMIWSTVTEAAIGDRRSRLLVLRGVARNLCPENIKIGMSQSAFEMLR